MNRIFLAACTILLLCSCGATRSIEKYEPDEITMGYNGVDSDKNNYAVSKVKPSKDKAITAYSDMYQYLQGRVPGLIVSGQNITIRGIGTNSGDSSPLILVDNVEMSDISSIDPKIVSSVEVLKDASASIYGIRGANGVILITTRKQ